MNEMLLQTYTEYLKKLNNLSNLDLVLMTRSGSVVADYVKNSKHKIIRERRESSRKKYIDGFLEKAVSDKEYFGDESPVKVDSYYFQGVVTHIDGSNLYLVIGPFYLKESVKDFIEADLPNYRIEDFMGALTLFREVPGAASDTNYRVDASADQIEFEREFDAREFNNSFSTSHIRYNARQERNIRTAITNGDIGYVKKCCDENYYMTTDHMLAGESQLTRARHGILSANSVYCRAAEDGGASSVLMRTICANYSEEILQCKNVAQLINLRREFSLLYCKKVKEAKQTKYSLHVSRCVNWMEENLAEDLTLSKAAEFCGVSYDYLSRLIKTDCGCSFSELVHRIRCRFATYYLQSEKEIIKVAEKCGYKSGSQFCHAFKKIYGKTPGQWQSEHLK
ncbi:DNA-binding domain-containing protein, AraC-type [Lachnospiraceae bacterium JC7]|nr:DNA-binding domain-containing protein, AraC-type [Lachnospiraceae bacterium JC7]